MIEETSLRSSRLLCALHLDRYQRHLTPQCAREVCHVSRLLLRDCKRAPELLPPLNAVNDETVLYTDGSDKSRVGCSPNTTFSISVLSG